MKKTKLSIMLLVVAISAIAQNSLDLGSRATLRQFKSQNIPAHNAYTKALKQHNIPTNHITGFIKLADNATVESLETEGVNVVRKRGNIALVSMPINEVERISSLKSVKRLQLSREIKAKMDKVRPAIGIDKIHAGTELPKAYTGKGVITGIVDNGIDPNHINFRNSDGTSRVSMLSHIYENSSSASGYSHKTYTSENISRFSTDNFESIHGTHTLGIMSGGYKDTAMVAEKESAFKNNVSIMQNPFYGIAYDSEIAASCGDLMDMFIALGVDDILNYAYDSQKPAVINMSLGSNIGAHDGTSLMNQFLDLAGEEAIICLSAGNEGDMPIALNQTFTKDDKEIKTFITPTYQNLNNVYHNPRYGSVYIYSNDTTTFTVKVVIFNKSRGTTTFQIPISSNTNGNSIYYASPSYSQEGDLSSSNFNRAFDGYVGIGSMIDTYSNRYYALIDYFTSDNQTSNANGNYVLGFIVEGKEGQRIDCFCDGSFTYFGDYAISGWDKGSTNGSISDMACGNNVVVVGSYNTRDEWASLDKKSYGYQGTFKPGKVSAFSSYGTLIDGRNLPHVCAPGAATISSSNHFYYASLSGSVDNMVQARCTESNRINYWQQQIGTSMAAPAVAGSIALWLEADPTLTASDVKEIIKATAVKDADVVEFTGDPVQWGAGKFDAYAGLKEVIRKASIDGISVDSQRVIVTPKGDGTFEIFHGGAQAINATLYSTSGQCVLTQTTNNDELIINTNNISSGIYILSVNGIHSQKIIIK